MLLISILFKFALYPRGPKTNYNKEGDDYLKARKRLTVNTERHFSLTQRTMDQTEATAVCSKLIIF